MGSSGAVPFLPPERVGSGHVKKPARRQEGYKPTTTGACPISCHQHRHRQEDCKKPSRGLEADFEGLVSHKPPSRRLHADLKRARCRRRRARVQWRPASTPLPPRTPRQRSQVSPPSPAGPTASSEFGRLPVGIVRHKFRTIYVTKE